mmetsp:Transcript_21963/g.44280  ORF Transcript_21963/g.44280 Transcript_21963/m.44280 type:complete len:286 (-) Transcript_21963:353-1210(-)
MALMQELDVIPRVGHEGLAEVHLGHAIGQLHLVLAAELLHHLHEQAVRGRAARGVLRHDAARFVDGGHHRAAVVGLVLQGARSLVDHRRKLFRRLFQGLRLADDAHEVTLRRSDRRQGAIASGVHQDQIRSQSLLLNGRAGHLRIAQGSDLRGPGLLALQLGKHAPKAADNAADAIRIHGRRMIEHGLHAQQYVVRVSFLPQRILDLRLQARRCLLAGLVGVLPSGARLRRCARLQEGRRRVRRINHLDLLHAVLLAAGRCLGRRRSRGRGADGELALEQIHDGG